MIKGKISKALFASALLILLSPISAFADLTTDNPSTGIVTAVNTQTAQPATPSTSLSSTGYQVSQLAPTASSQLAAVGLGAVDQTITPEMGLFTTNNNVVSNEQQLPVNFTPGIIQYNHQSDRSARIDGQLTSQQMQTLNGYSDRWMNSLRHIWQSLPTHYSYHGQRYQAPNDLITPPSLFNAISQMAADRTRVHYGYEHTGDERLALDTAGDTAYGQYISQANLTPSETVVHQVAPNATGTSFVVGENLFKLSGNTMLEAEVNLFNRMQDMLWGEATNLNGKLEGANDHLANALNPLFTHTAMGFQLVSPNHWYVTWDFEGLDNVDPLTGQRYFSDKERIVINQLWDQLLLGGQAPAMNKISSSQQLLALKNKGKDQSRVLSTTKLILPLRKRTLRSLIVTERNFNQISLSYCDRITKKLTNIKLLVAKNGLLPATGNNSSLTMVGIVLLMSCLVGVGIVIKWDIK